MTTPFEKIIADADRYSWLRCGGWEVLQDPKYWRPGLQFDEVVDRARAESDLHAALRKAMGSEIK